VGLGASHGGASLSTEEVKHFYDRWGVANRSARCGLGKSGGAERVVVDVMVCGSWFVVHGLWLMVDG
jgi:hypothetical protein